MAIENVPISQEIRDAIVEGKGEIGQVLDCVLAYEIGDWKKISCDPFSEVSVGSAYLEAISWTLESLVDK